MTSKNDLKNIRVGLKELYIHIRSVVYVINDTFSLNILHSKIFPSAG